MDLENKHPPHKRSFDDRQSDRTSAMSDSNKHAWQQLLETGALVEFRILDTHTELSPDKENIAVRADLVFTGDDIDMDPADVVEWGAFGFLFVLASLSLTGCRAKK